MSRCLCLVCLAIWYPAAAHGQDGGSTSEPDCVFLEVTNPEEVGDYLLEHLAAKGLSPTGWSASISGSTARLTLKLAAGPVSVDISLGEDCARPLRVQATGPGAAGTDWQTLMSGLPLRRARPDRQDHFRAEGWPWLPLALWSGPFEDRVFAWLTLLLLVGLALRRPSPASRLPSAAAFVAIAFGLALAAAWPVFPVAFTTDAQVLRAAFARVDVFGDWNHPFLSYLLNRPAALLSLEPWALRVIPFLFVVAEVLLVKITAARSAGRLAGWLAAIFFACEVRRRHGLTDLGDWDLAGAILMGMLLWMQARDEDQSPPRWHAAALCAALVILGVLSSWLLVVPSGVLVGCLWFSVRRGRILRSHAVVITLAFLLVGLLAARVFLLGAESPEPSLGTFEGLLRDMAYETPAGRTIVMALPLTLGVGWLLLGLWRPSHVFAAISLILVPIAVTVSYFFSHVNGGYYIGLITPLLAWAAGAGTGQAIAWAMSRVRGLGGAVARLASVLGVAVLTVSQGEILMGETGGVERIPELDRLVAESDGPVLTNWMDLGRVVAYERARAGQGDVRHMLLDGGPPDIADRVRLLDLSTCEPGKGGPNGHFFLVLAYFDRPAAEGCQRHFGDLCREVLSEKTHSGDRERLIRYFDCHRPEGG